MKTFCDAVEAVLAAWPGISSDCLEVIGSELHYHAMIYHRLRLDGKVPMKQLGMNVQMFLEAPVTEYFKNTIAKNAANKSSYDLYTGIAPTPDVVIFGPEINGDWRRRNSYRTLQNTLIGIEIKVSERKGTRLSVKEIKDDIEKLSAQREEICHLGADMFPIMMILDSAPDQSERMKPKAIEEYRRFAHQNCVAVLHCSRDTAHNICTIGNQQLRNRSI